MDADEPPDAHAETGAQDVDGYSYQFYIPVDASQHPHAAFDAGDRAQITVLPHRGLLLTPPEVDVDRAKVLEGLDGAVPAEQTTLDDPTTETPQHTD